jgi:hypothetical protein
MNTDVPFTRLLRKGPVSHIMYASTEHSVKAAVLR